MGLFINPLSHAGYPPGVTGTPETQPSEVRAATVTEANAGVLDSVYISPATLAGFSSVASFASPPVLGFGSTTPRPVHATTLSAVGTTTINTSGAATTTIGTGGTGAVNIGNATGNTAVTGSLSTTTSLSATTSVTAGTTVTATLGAITATNGNLVLGTAGNKLSIATGSNASLGTSGALGTGTVTVSTTAVKTASKIFLTRAVAGGTLGNLSVGTIVDSTSFTITSDNNADTSTVNWLIIN
jgi:hypothetical protein